MKKKLLLTVIFVMAVVCMFAVSVSATTINKDTTVTLDGSFTDVNGNAITTVNLYDNDGDALIWYLNTDGKLVSAKIASLVTVNNEGVISFTEKTVFLGSNPAKSVIAVNLRNNVKVSGTDINWDGQIKHFDGSKGTNSGIDMDETGFQFGTYGGSGYTIQYFYFPTTTETIVKRMFQGTPVKVADIEPGTPISTMGVLVFYGANKLEAIYVPNDIETFPSSEGQGMFQNCSSLSSVTFEENSKLWNAGYNTFYGCSSLKKLYLPNSVKTFGSEFARSSGIEEFSFGAGFEYFSMRRPGTDPDDAHMWVFWGSQNLKKVYMPASFAILNDKYAFDDYVSADERLDEFDRIFNSAGSFTLFFTGTKEEIETLKTRIAYTQENQSLVSALNNISSYDEYVAAGSPTGSCAVYGYNVCDAFYNSVHDIKVEGENKCCGVCANCKLTEMLENPTHTYEWIFNGGKDISYTTAFNAENKCKFCATANQDEKIVEIGAILYSNGISIDETDYTGIYEQIKVDKTALEAYSTLSGKQFDYGIFALAAGEAQTSAPITKGENGKGVAVDQNTVFASFTGTEYTYLRIKITGSPNGGSIFCGAYLVIGDDIVYVSNKQEGKEVNKYTMVTEQA